MKMSEHAAIRGAALSLDDKYLLDEGRAYMTGIQALVRLTLAQQRRDAALGLHTAGFVSGYRGSPLGSLDASLWQADKLLRAHDVVFQPGVNEDLAATAVWGSQQAQLAGQGRYDGVVGWWYGKGPGVDRSGDVLRHANLAGTAERGGAVALYGDDHSCKSSSIPHQSEHVMMGSAIPVLYPASVQQILDFGAHAVALSRCAGVWTSLKLVSEIVETSASVDVALQRVRPALDFERPLPSGGLGIRWPDRGLAQEERLHRYKLPAVLAYARANGLNRVSWDCAQARLGIAASGKAYLDTMEALRLLGLDREAAGRLGLRLYQIGLIWPLEPHGLREFAAGLEEVIVVEEKRAFLELQIKDELYGLPDHLRPSVVGKTADGRGEWSTPAGAAPLISYNELQPEGIARMLAARFLRLPLPDDLRALIERQLGRLDEAQRQSQRVIDIAERKPYFCSGCPHNTSTVLPAGSRAVGGIGCHFLALTMERGTETFTQMGGEGVTWVGAAPFTREAHVFANLGDGTYFHSGLLAIRQAVAAKVNITYKILYNDAVGMTGGQSVDGTLSVARLTRQLAAEGVARIVVVGDEPALLGQEPQMAAGVTIHPRAELDALQRELCQAAGVTVLVYAQTCASEKRRRRKRGSYPDPVQRIHINAEVCEGCGDCSRKSNCLSVEPLETDLGSKRRINQSSCNKDFSCADGFCPSFVTVHARGPQSLPKPAGLPPDWPAEPQLPALEAPLRIVVGGVGGTGVVTIGALLGVAAHLEGKAVRVLDIAGMAQKGGAVHSYVQLAKHDEDIAATKVAAAQCDLLIGADAVVAGHTVTLTRLRAGGMAIVNQDGAPTADFIKQRDWRMPLDDLLARVRARLQGGQVLAVPGNALASAILGDAIFANLLLLGMAWQSGRLPLQRASIERAIELNGAAVAKNREAFRLGCHLASDAALAARLLSVPAPAAQPQTLAQLVEDRARRLRVYWSAAYAARYRALMQRVEPVVPAALAWTLATQLYRVMAYKDEYEVARLLTSADFRRSLEREFGRGVRWSYHLAPPALGTGAQARKRRFGPWFGWPMRLLARLRWLRETPLDVFGWHAERRRERAWRDKYMAFVERLAQQPALHDSVTLARLAELPAAVRGFGHVKLQALDAALARWDQLESGVALTD